jgi:hypothetical protein
MLRTKLKKREKVDLKRKDCTSNEFKSVFKMFITLIDRTVPTLKI